MLLPTVVAIQIAVREMYGFQPKPCWIADVKEQLGYSVRPAWNRQGAERLIPCPAKKIAPIRETILRLSRDKRLQERA